jgi:mRNA interferase MazF
MELTNPHRGEIWLAALGAARRGEPGKNRPVIVLSADELLVGVEHELIVVVPLSSSLPSSLLRPKVTPDAGIDNLSSTICRGIRGVARSRLLQPLGAVGKETMAEVERALGLVLATG